MMLTAVQASAHLHHLHFYSPDPDRLADFYGAAIDMRRERDGDVALLRGPDRHIAFSRGEARTLREAGFALRDADGLAGLRERAEARGLGPSDASSVFFRAGAFAVTDPDGNRIVFGLAAEDPPADRPRLPAATQHLTLATQDVAAIEHFYADGLGFAVSDRVATEEGEVMTTFMRSTHEHHTLACFFHRRTGVDHHSYETNDWSAIRDWCDHFAGLDIQLTWGPGRHGPGNNLFAFVVDPDGNWVEISAELEVVHDRPVKTWPHAERTLNLWGRGLLRVQAP